jgi:hypothetical protein
MANVRFMSLALAACQSTETAEWISMQRFRQKRREAATITI